MQDWINDHPLFFAALIVLAIALFWCFVVNMISLASGWRMLGRRFRTDQPFMGSKWNWQSAGMRFTRYNNCLTVGADPVGVFLRTMFMFRPGHPALFIPWTEIAVSSRSTIFGQYPQLMLGSSEHIPLTINPMLASRLKSTAGTSWPAGMGTPGAGTGAIS